MSDESNKEIKLIFDRLMKISALLPVILGLAGLAGWVFDFPLLVTLIPGTTAFKFNAALSVVILGMVLFFLSIPISEQRRKLSGFLSAAVFVISAATITQHLFGISLGIDELFVSDTISTPETNIPGRAGINTLLILLFLSPAVFLIAARGKNSTSYYLSLIPLSLSFLGITGYIFEERMLYGFLRYSSMSFPAALSLFFLSSGTVIASGVRGVKVVESSNAGGYMARRLIPAVIIIPMVYGWVRLKGRQLQIFDVEFDLSVFIFVLVTVLLIVILFYARQLNNIDAERVVAIRHLKRLNRFYTVIGGINQAITRTRDKDELLNAICRITAESGGFRFACLAFHDGNHGDINTIYYSGYTYGKKDEEVQSRVKEFLKSNCPGSLPLTSPVIINNLDLSIYTDDPSGSGINRESIAESNISGSAVLLPVQAEDFSSGVFIILSDEAELFAQEESELVKRIGHDISFALNSLVKEEKRRKAEEKLKENEKIMTEAQRLSNMGYWVLDMLYGNLIWSDQIYSICGIAPDSGPSNMKEFIELVYPEDRPVIFQTVDNILTEKKGQDYLYRIVRKDGELRSLKGMAEPIFDINGNPVKMIGFVRDVTEETALQDKLRNSESLVRSILETLPVGVWATDEKGNIILGNKAGWDIWRGEKYVGPDNYGEFKARWMSTGEVIKPEEWGLYRALNNGEASINELIKVECFDGSEKVVLNSASPVCDQNGKVICAIAVNLDITEKIRAEEELKEAHRKLQDTHRELVASNSKIQSIVEGTSDMIAAFDKQLRLITFNSAFKQVCKRIYGLNVEPGMSLSESLLDLPVDKENIEKYWMRVLAGESFTVTDEFGDENLQRNVYEIRFSPMYDEKGILTGGSQITRDITERRRAEEKIIHLNRIYAFLSQINQTIVHTRGMQQLFDAVCNIAVEYGKFRMAWIGMAEEEDQVIKLTSLAGYSEGYAENLFIPLSGNTPEAMGPTAKVIHSGKYYVVNDIAQSPVMEPWKNAALERCYRSSASFPIIVFHKTRGVFNIYSDEVNFFDEQEINLLMELSQDISYAIEFIEREKQRLQAEEEIKRLNEELEKRVVQRTAELQTSNKELEAFAYSVSHDLRAPLRHIDGFIKLLEKNSAPKLDENGKRYISYVSQSTRKMGMLIDDLLAFSRMGRTDMNKTAVSMITLIKNVIRELADETEGREVEWVIKDLSEVYADPAMLKLALVNLLSNALKFTRTKPKARIEIGLYEQKPDETVYYIADNGVGFDMEYAGKLFGVFQRLHSEEEFEGTGIGLANVKRIISRHGGTVWAEGRLNEGACFYFSIPCRINKLQED